jgi:hypothetical protein
MDPTIQRPDEELAQRAPLVPDIGHADTRTDGGRTADGETTRRATRQPPRTDATRRRADDELAQEAPLVPDLGRPTRRPTEGRR